MNWPKLLLRLALGRRLPTHAGEVRVQGLNSRVTIRRDEFGIPHIEAASTLDGLFGLGNCHAQDRTFQLETLLRLGRGTLAALVGAAALPVDRLSRRIGFFRSAQQQFQILPEASQQRLQSYVAGVNAAHEYGYDRLPHEFAILGSSPTPWQPADVLAYLKLQSFLLPSNWDVELARLKILLLDGPEVLRQLEPGFAEWHPTTLPNIASGRAEFLQQFEAELALFQQYTPAGGGSNNWVIGGSRTASGLPLLANDPHLPAGVPAAWYLASIRTPEGIVAGASFAGCPAFPTGHNGHSCWGITAGLIDNTDWFIETLGPDRRSVRQADGSFAPVQVIREIISVKKQADVVEEVLITPRGPIITPFLGPDDIALSLAAVWLKPLPLNGFFQSYRETTFDGFRYCFKEWPALPLNLVYADQTGETGWQLVGQIPQRNGHHGMLPVRADLPGVGWASELVPFVQMPFAHNPPFLATANQRPTSSPKPFLGYDYCESYRAIAILQELEAKPSDWTVEACQQLQKNVKCIPWVELRPLIVAVSSNDADVQLGLDLLRNWDGEVTSDSAAATVYELLISALVQSLAKQLAPKSWRIALGETGSGPFSHSLFSERRFSWLVRVLREPPLWWKSTLNAEVEAALRGIVPKLRQERGPSPDWWSWGDLRHLRVQHPLFGPHWLLGRCFNLPPMAGEGDSQTVSQAGQRVLEPTAAPHMIANLRAVYDTSDFSKSRFSLAGGQSGNPLSPNFGDLLPYWRDGRGIALPFTQEQELRSAKQTLTLLPS